ncbi:toxin-antitoxin system YwqK family antitoxin [Bacteroidota bacterium]
MNKNSLKFIVAVLTIFHFFIYLSCSEESRVPATNLELRDSLIYTKGSDIPFSGREYARIENKIIEYDVVDGVKHGEFLLYYESGKLEIKGELVNNLNEGRWQYYYESGQIESEGDFVDNQPDGIWRWYYRSGKLREEGLFQKGKRQGVWKEFDELGIVLNEKDYSIPDSLSTPSDILINLKNPTD